MSAIINQSTDHTFIGNLKSTTLTVNGVFVTPNYASKTATPVADATAGDKAGLMMVYNQNTYTDSELVADADFSVKVDRYLRLKPFLPTNVFTTDQFIGEVSAFKADDVVAVGAGGKLVGVGTRTPRITFVVKEITTLYGKPALKVAVLSV